MNFENEVVRQEKPMVSYCWKGLALFLLGVVVGFIFSPMKNGISMFNNSHFGNDCDEKDNKKCCYNNEDDLEF